MAIKTVAVIGASGNVGAPTVKALQAAGFKVTAITRPSSTATFPSDVSVRTADLTDVAALTAAFEGQDAVVATIASAAVGEQHPLVDAAVAAGVKRFIPSEFGHNVLKLSGAMGALLQGKTDTIPYLTEQAKAHPSFTWTGIATSPFFDWGLDYGVWGFSLKDKTARILDSGDEPVSTSTLEFVGEAVAAVLVREEETRNRYIDVVEFNVSQNEVLRLLEAETGEKFAVSHGTTAELQRAGEEKIAKGDFWGSFLDILLAWTFKDGANRAVKAEDLANEELGLRGKTVQERVKEYVQSRSA